MNAATFCIYSQLGIKRKFDLSTSEGWGKKPGEFMANLSAIRKIQKEITTGMKREMRVIASLERELAQAEAHVDLLRTKLSTIGVQTPKPGSAQPAEHQKLSPPAPIIKEAQARPSRSAEPDYWIIRKQPSFSPPLTLSMPTARSYR